jgi:hypothetical protein
MAPCHTFDVSGVSISLKCKASVKINMKKAKPQSELDLLLS